MADLIDLMMEDEPSKPGERLEHYPTFCYEPQKNKQVRQALKQRDWWALNAMQVVWYDQYARRWFKFGPHFWDVIEYLPGSSIAPE